MKLSGVVKIDNQHAMLFDVINRARSMVSTNQFIALLDLLGKLSNYIHMHFHDEEMFMLEKKIPGYDAHVAAHRRFKEVVQEHMDELLKVANRLMICSHSQRTG